MKILFSSLLLLGSITSQTLAHQQVSIVMPQQSWQFELRYGVLQQDKARLSSNEQAIAERIKPLLMAKDYRGAWDEVKSYPVNSASAALAQAIGQIAMQLSHDDAAIEAFNAALKKRPDLLPSYRALGAIYLKQDKKAQAVEMLTKALQLGDQDASLFAQIAYLHMQQNQAYAAVAGFRQALFLAPNHADYKKGLLWALTQAGDTSEARMLLNQLIEENPNDDALWLHLSQIQLQRSEQKEALASLEIAARLGNESISNQILTAQLHLTYGDENKAVTLLKKALAQGAKPYYGQMIEAVSLLVSEGFTKKAGQLASALEKQSNELSSIQQSELLTFQGALAQENGNTKKAQQYYTSAISAHAGNGRAMLELGQLLQRQKQYAIANSFYTRAATLAPYKEQAWLLSAQIAIDKGDFDKAIALLNKAYQQNQSRRDLLGNIKQLERLKRAM